MPDQDDHSTKKRENIEKNQFFTLKKENMWMYEKYWNDLFKNNTDPIYILILEWGKHEDLRL